LPAFSYQNRKNVPNEHKINQNGHRMSQISPQKTSIKFIALFQSKALQNLPKLGFLAKKTNHLATLLRRTKAFGTMGENGGGGRIFCQLIKFRRKTH
jgi:hypothetical protein